MTTVVKYKALKNASNTLQAAIDSDILYKSQQTLTEIYEWLKAEDIKHQCFDQANNILTDVQSDSIKVTEDYMRLATIIPIIIESFSSTEENAIRNLKEFINDFFKAETVGLFPFIYKEMQMLNEEGNGKYDLRVQGYTKAGDYYLITAYDHNHNLNSRVYIYDKTGRCIGYIKFHNKEDKNAHVGGITYDEENNIVFITGKEGKVNTYKLNDITDALNQVNLNSNKVPSIPSDEVLISHPISRIKPVPLPHITQKVKSLYM